MCSRLLGTSSAINRFFPGMRGMLGAGTGGGMLEALESSTDITLHGNVDPTLGIVPIEVEAAVKITTPIDRGLVILLNGVDEVEGIGFGEVFHTKVVDAKGERGRTGGMFPQTRSELHRCVPERLQVFNQVLESDKTCFLQTIDTLTGLKVRVAIVFDADLRVFLQNFGREERGRDTDILVIGKGGAKVEIFDV